MLRRVLSVAALGALLVLALCAVYCAAAPPGYAPCVRLSWPESRTRGIAGYDVYRATCFGRCDRTPPLSSFARLNFEPVRRGDYAAPKLLGLRVLSMDVFYIDYAVQAGATYAYFFIAVCPYGGCGGDVYGASAPSNFVIVTVGDSGPSIGRLGAKEGTK